MTHIKWRHGAAANPSCDKCDKTFPSVRFLRKHQRIVHDENEAKCEICDKICKNRSLKFECSICHKILAERSLANHMRAHSTEDYVGGDRSTSSETKVEHEKFPTGTIDFDKPNLQAAPQPTIAEAQEESLKEPKRWVKSAKVEKFAAKSRIKLKLFQTFFACPHCHLVVNYQKQLRQHLKDCSQMNQFNIPKEPFEEIFLKFED